ncbi:hypothetical protein BDV3_005494 [Batrachochytrium dendrobatidis]
MNPTDVVNCEPNPYHIESNSSSSFKIGDHVCADSAESTHTYNGTLVFLGETQFSDGIWAGIELFEHGTGLNNGTFQEIVYFVCPDNTGVFVPLHKLRTPTRFVQDVRMVAETAVKEENIDVPVAAEPQEISIASTVADAVVSKADPVLNVANEISSPVPIKEAPKKLKPTLSSATKPLSAKTSKTTVSPASKIKSATTTKNALTSVAKPAVHTTKPLVTASKSLGTVRTANTISKFTPAQTAALKRPAVVTPRPSIGAVSQKPTSSHSQKTVALSTASLRVTPDKKLGTALTKKSEYHVPATKKPIAIEPKSTKVAVRKPSVNASLTTVARSAVSSISNSPRKLTGLSASSPLKAAKPSRPETISNIRATKPIATKTAVKATPAESIGISTLQTRIATLESENETLIKKIGQVQQNHMDTIAHSSTFDDVEILKTELSRMTELNNSLKIQVSLLTQETDSLKLTFSQTIEQHASKFNSDDMEEQLLAATSKASAATMAMLELQETLTKAEAEHATSREALATLDSEREALTVQLNQLSNDHKNQKNELLTVQSLFESERKVFTDQKDAYEAELSALKQHHDNELQEHSAIHKARSIESNSELLNDIQVLKQELLHKSNDIVSITEKMQHNETRLASISESHETLLKEIDSKNAALLDKDVAIASLKADLSSVHEQHDRALLTTTDTSVFTEQIQHLTLELEKANAMLSQERADAKEKINDANEQFSKERTSTQLMASQFEDANAKIQFLEDTIIELKSASSALIETVSQKESAIKEFEHYVDQLKQESKDSQEYEAVIEQHRTAHADITARLLDALAQIDAKDETVFELTLKINELSNATIPTNTKPEEIECLREQLALKNQEYSHLADQLESATKALDLATFTRQEQSDADAKMLAALEESKTCVDQLNDKLAETETMLVSVSTKLSQTEEFLEAARQENSDLHTALANAEMPSVAQKSIISQEELAQIEENATQKDVLIEAMRNEFENAVNDLDSQIMLAKQLQDQLAQSESALSDKSILIDVLYRQSQEQSELDQAKLDELQQICDQQAAYMSVMSQEYGFKVLDQKNPLFDTIVEEHTDTPHTASQSSTYMHENTAQKHVEVMESESVEKVNQAHPDKSSHADSHDLQHSDEKQTFKHSVTSETLVDNHFTHERIQSNELPAEIVDKTKECKTVHSVTEVEQIPLAFSAKEKEIHGKNVDAEPMDKTFHIAQHIDEAISNPVAYPIEHSKEAVVDSAQPCVENAPILNHNSFEHHTEHLSSITEHAETNHLPLVQPVYTENSIMHTNGVYTDTHSQVIEKEKYVDDNHTADVTDQLLMDDNHADVFKQVNGASTQYVDSEHIPVQSTTSMHDAANSAQTAAGCKQQ